MADERQGPGPVGGSIAGMARSPLGRDADVTRPDLEGARATAEDVGSLPVPRSVRQQKGLPLDSPAGSPYDLERGLLPGARRPVRPASAAGPQRHEQTLSQEDEARLRRERLRAARTPEELGRALARLGDAGLRDPQRGREAGPPLPGEPGYGGDE